MKFSCSKSLLSETISNVSLAVGSKASMPIIEGILISTQNNSLTLTCYNLELGISKTIDAHTIESGNVVLNASLLANIINKMPDGIIVCQVENNLLTKIMCNDIEFTIPGLDGGSFPELPLVQNDRAIDIEYKLLTNMLEQTIFASSVSEQTPINTGCLIELNNNILTIVAVDGFRLALRKEPVPIKEEIKIIVPTKTLSDLLKLINKLPSDAGKENVKILVSKNHVVFDFCGYYIISRLIEGEFIDYNKVIPPNSKTIVNFKTKELIDSINRATIIISDKTKTGIKAVITQNGINILCETILGKINENIPITFAGDEIKIGFNHRYMLDALKACDCEEAKMLFNGATSPIKITPIDDDSFLFLVLPIRLKDDE